MNEALITTSWDDGHPLDLKLGRLLKKYEIPATFYIPITNWERNYMVSNQIKKIAKDFDIGGHGLSHTDLTRISPKETEREILESKRKLEEITGREVISFSYPYGSFNREIINIMKRSGFVGARTTIRFMRSYKKQFEMGTTTYADKPLKISISNITIHKCFVNTLDFKFLYFVIKNNLFNQPWDKIAVKTLGFIAKNGGIWHLWGHSWEIDENKDWKKLENVFKTVKKITEEYNIGMVNNSELISIFSK